MRVSVLTVAVAATVCVVAAGIAAGCGSSSSSPPAGVEDASPEAAIADGGSASVCHVEASLAGYAASDATAASCAACINDNCNDAVQACASDCVCINLFSCLLDTDATTSAAASETISVCAGNSGLSLLSNPGVRGLANCYSGPCLAPCSMVFPVDASADGPSEAAESGSNDGGDAAVVDAGAVLDATDGG
jgi:hypothetical protein